MASKKSTTIQYAKALYNATKDLKGKDLEKALYNFVALLVRDHKLKKADKIIAEFVKYAKSQEGIVSLTVTTAHQVSDKELSKIGNAFSNQTEVVPMVDKNLIGGFVAKTEEVIFDASIKKQLQILKQKLI